MVNSDLLIFFLISLGLTIMFFIIIALFIDRQARIKIVDPINNLTNLIENPETADSKSIANISARKLTYADR